MSNQHINLIFLSNISYSSEIAVARRIHHFIEYLSKYPDIHIQWLYLPPQRQRISAARKRINQRIFSQTIERNHLPGYGNIFKFFKYYFQGVRFLKSNYLPGQKNILYIHRYPDHENLFLILSAKLIGYKIIFDIDDNFYADIDFQNSFFNATNQFVLRPQKWLQHLANHIIVSSTSFFKKFSGQNLKNQKVTVLPVTIQADKFQWQLHGFYEPVKIFYNGNFLESDRIENLINAFEQIAGRYPESMLYLSGMGVSKRIDWIKSHINDSPFHRRIQYLGYLTENSIYQFLKSCDMIYAVQGNYSGNTIGFPAKLAEYLATGKSVLAPRSAEIPKYLADKKNVIFVNPGNIDSISAGIEYLLKNRDLAVKIGLAGQRVALQNFDIQVVGQKFYKILQIV